MTTPFRRVLVANRGEIAARIIRTVRDLGYESVAVFSVADADAPHVAMADRAVPLGEPLAARSYLDPENILRAARAAGADAIHPGYGFLSENAGFAERCAQAGLTFIGPHPDTIRVMGDKRLAKERMIAAGVPCIPGHLGAGEDDDAFAEAASAIGFPVIVKAAAGGGGRGMRLVRRPDELTASLAAARSEAMSAFADGTVYLEKLVEQARHIEIQVMADRYGNVLHLGERDCSVQRRFQKVIEEAPSPFVDPPLRARMGAAAVAAARAVDYLGAGTVEFLVGQDGEFYFIEMNTRLQVEHPVTEMVTGLDLVELQLRVAAGEPLPFRQEDVVITGHAIEARLYAEDPAQGYLPQSGPLLRWRPENGAGIRIDSGFREGQDVTSHYDAMIAKVIAHGPSRDAARRRLAGALRRTPLLGLATNRGLLLAICDDPVFASGEATTDFLGGDPPERPDGGRAGLARIAAALLHGWPDHYSLARWRSAGPAEWALDADGDPVVIRRNRTGAMTATAAGQEIEVEPLEARDGEFRCRIGEVVHRFAFVRTSDILEVDCEGIRVVARRFRPVGRGAGQAAGAGVIVAPMNGRIIKVEASPGQVVARGQTLVVIEAMKMEMNLSAPADGIVGSVAVGVGEQVSARQPLLVVEPVEEEVRS